MNNEFRKFGSFNTAKYNPRVDLKPGDPEWKDIEASIEKYGQVQNLVLNARTNTLVGGHQRCKVMQAMGREGAWFHIVDLSPEDEQALNLILNKVSGRWDKNKLGELLKGMQERQINLTNLGFTPKELAEVISPKGSKTKRDPNTASTVPMNPKTKRGDLYVITTAAGTRHRLLNGDSENPEDFARLMEGAKARIIFTDPPYNVAYESNRGDLEVIANDNMDAAAFGEFLRRCFQAATPHTAEKAAFYCFYASRNHIAFETALNLAGWKVRQQLIWGKQMALSRSDYHWNHEPMLYCQRTGSTLEWFGDRTEKTLHDTTPEDIKRMSKEDAVALLLRMREQTDIWDVKRDPVTKYIHPTQKPIELAQRAMRNSTLPGDSVLELFTGSGSTLIAAETLGRFGYGMELSANHCDSIVRRFFETFEGVSVTRNGEPITIEDVAK